MKKLALALVTFALAVPAALAGGTPGVSSAKLVIGSSGPLTGEANAAASVLRGEEAYFAYVNARGGVGGRKIDFEYLDDGGDPLRTVGNVRELIQQNSVFALFSVVGTSSNLAIRDLTNAAKVPVVFSAAGATALGRDHGRYPNTIGYPPPSAEEGAIYAKHVLATNPRRAKVAVLYQSDDHGKDLLAGFKRGFGPTNRKLLVSSVGYDPTIHEVESQIAQLEASGANTLCVFASGRYAIEALASASKLGWKPRIYVNHAASASSIMRLAPQRTAEGSISIVFAKDPTTPKLAGDPGIELAAKIARRYLSSARPQDAGLLVEGMAQAYSLVDALENTGRTPTREGLIGAVTHMNEASNPFLLPGINVRTTPKFRFPISQVGLQRWHKGHWVLFGGLQSARP